MPQRPLTQQEIKRQKAKESDEQKLTVCNRSNHMIPIHLRKPNSDFYVGEQVVRVSPGKSYTDRYEMFNMDQLHNLKVKGELQLIEQ